MAVNASPIPRLADIARAAGVSMMTASCAVRGVGRTSAETREAVLRVARDLGYRPNVAARATVTGRFNCVAMVLSTDPRRSSLPRLLLNGVHEELSVRRMHLSMAIMSDEKLSSEVVVPRVLNELMADGLLVNYTDHVPPQLVDLLGQHRIPTTWLNLRREADCVYSDDLDAGYRAARHLLSLGHTRIAYVDFSHAQQDVQSVHYSAADREAGCAKALAEVGLSLRVLRAERKIGGEERPAIARQLFTGSDRPTAVVAYSGSTAGPVMLSALLSGLRVPDDLSIVTFDDEGHAPLGVRFTTMIAPREEMGRSAVQMLADRIDRPGRPGKALSVRFGFDEGRSCGPPAI